MQSKITFVFVKSSIRIIAKHKTFAHALVGCYVCICFIFKGSQFN